MFTWSIISVEILKSQNNILAHKICTSRRTITHLLIQKDLRLFFLFFFYLLINHHVHKFTFITTRPSLACFWFFVFDHIELDHRSDHSILTTQIILSLVCATCSPQKGRKSSSKDWRWQKLSGKWFWRRCRSSLTWKETKMKIFFLFINRAQNSSDQLGLAHTTKRKIITTQTTPPTSRTTTDLRLKYKL